MSVSNKEKKDCCGCNACAEICPKHCITMTHDKVGFQYPKVDSTVCIECGACERVCPFDNPNSKNEFFYPQKALAAYLKDQVVHKRSSSGGASFGLCKNILKEHGVVYGCAAEGTDVRHIRIESLEELPRIQGSKYVQSNVNGLFACVKADLEQNRKVAFVGTPCQIAGLKKFLRKPYDGLLLIDLICHGTPSLQMLKEHIAKVAREHSVDRITFRSGNDYVLNIFENGKSIWTANLWQKPFKDMYYRAFIDGTSTRPSCHVCPFCRSERVSDITIGDFWGLKDYNFKPDGSNLGTSVIMPITNKGRSAVDGLSPEMNLKERPVTEAIAGNSQLNHPVPEGHECATFFKLYPAMSFDKAVWLSVSSRMAIYYIRRTLSPLKRVIKASLNELRRR